VTDGNTAVVTSTETPRDSSNASSYGKKQQHIDSGLAATALLALSSSCHAVMAMALAHL